MQNDAALLKELSNASLKYDPEARSLSISGNTDSIGKSLGLNSDSAFYKGYYDFDSSWPYRNYYWPTTVINREDTYRQAFNLVEMLMAKGYIEKLSVKQFMDLVKEIAAKL